MYLSIRWRLHTSSSAILLFYSQINFFSLTSTTMSILLSSLITNAQFVLALLFMWFFLFSSERLFFQLYFEMIPSSLTHDDETVYEGVNMPFSLISLKWQKETNMYSVSAAATTQPIYSSLCRFSSADTRLSQAARLPQHGIKRNKT